MPELLLVDDDTSIAAALRVRMKAAGLDVRYASNGLAALEAVKEKTPDVALLDIRMPGIDGIELCRRFKAEPASAAFPVLFLSAESSERTRTSALEAGGEQFISKPYEAKELVGLISEVLENSQSKDEK